MANLSASSTVRLHHTPGAMMPVIALGVYQSTAAKESVSTALQVGYRHIDSARLYRNEADVATSLKASGIKREEVWLTTKIMSSEHSTKACEAAIKSSTAKLGNDDNQIWDLILLHDPQGGKSLRAQAWNVLRQAKQSGKVKSIGVSNWGVRHMQELGGAKEAGIDVNQVELHPWCQQREITQYCKENNVIVQAYCPIVRGEKNDDETLNKIAKETGKTPAQVLIRWSLQKGFVPLPKSDTPSRIKENFQVFDWSLSDEQMQTLDGLDQGPQGAISWNPVDAA